MPEFILFWYVGWQVGAENVYIWSLSLRSWLQNTIQGYRGFSIDLQWNTLLVFLTIDNLNTQNPVLLCRCQCGSTKACEPCWSNSKSTLAVLINISENIFTSNYAKIKVFFYLFCYLCEASRILSRLLSCCAGTWQPLLYWPWKLCCQLPASCNLHLNVS